VRRKKREKLSTGKGVKQQEVLKKKIKYPFQKSVVDRLLIGEKGTPQIKKKNRTSRREGMGGKKKSKKGGEEGVAVP